MKLILGTVQFGLDYGINNSEGKPSYDVVKDILDLAFENDIRILDTAEAYGNSQEVIGNYNKNSKDKFDIITKFSSKRTDLSLDFIDRIKQNIGILGVTSLYGYMFHSFSDFDTYFVSYKRDIIKAKEMGLLEKFGVSVYTNDEFQNVLAHDDVDLIQIPFNIFDNYSIKGTLIEEARRMGKIVHTRSAFLQGLFFKNPNENHEIVQKFNKELVVLNSISKEEKLSIASLALNYCLQQDSIDNVIIGVDSTNQLRQNLKIINDTLNSQTIKALNAIEVVDKKLLNPSNWN